MDSWISIKAKGKNTERIFLAYITITILSLLHKVINIFFLEFAQHTTEQYVPVSGWLAWCLPAHLVLSLTNYTEQFVQRTLQEEIVSRQHLDDGSARVM